MSFSQADAVRTEEQQQVVPSSTRLNRRRHDIHSELLDFRDHLLIAVADMQDVQPLVQGFVHVDVPLKEKFIALRVTELLKRNSESIKGLKHIHSGLGTIIRFAKHLIKDHRQDQWATISFKNPIVQKKILPMNGYPEVLSQLGYTERIDCGQSFPTGKDPDKQAVVNLIADMELFLAELKTFCSGRHPHPESVGQYLPQHLRDELEVRQNSNLSMAESSYNWSSSTSTLDSQENQAISQCGWSSSASTLDSQENQAISQSTDAAVNLENNNNLDSVDARPSCSAPGKESKTKHAGTSPLVGRSATPGNNADQTSETLIAGQNPADIVNGQTSGEKGSEAIESDTGGKSVVAEMLPADDSVAIQELAGAPEMSSASESTPPSAARETVSDTSINSRLSCSVCGEDAVYVCRECYEYQKALCESCNASWHKHKDRRHHRPQPISGHHGLSLESAGSGHNAVCIDEAYGITAAASRQRHGKQQQTFVVNNNLQKREDHLAPSVTDQESLLEKGVNHLPQNHQAEDFKLLDFQKQQQQQRLLAAHSQVSPQPYPSGQSPMFQQGQFQHHLQSYNSPYQPVHQQAPANLSHFQRMSALASSAYSQPAVLPAYPASQGMAMMIPPNMSSNAGPRVLPQEMGGQYTVAGHPYQGLTSPAIAAASSQSIHPFMTNSVHNQDHLFHQQQQQRQRGFLPPYINAQLDKNVSAQPNFAPCQSLIYPHMNPAFQQQMQQQHYNAREETVGPRYNAPTVHGYPADMTNTVFNSPPPLMYPGRPQFRHPHPYISSQIQGQPQSLQTPMHQSILLPNHQHQHQFASMGPGMSEGNSNLPLQQCQALHSSSTGLADMNMVRGPFPGLNNTNIEKPVIQSPSSNNSQNRDTNFPREVDLTGEHVRNAESAHQPLQSKRGPIFSDISSPFISAPSSPLATPPPQQSTLTPSLSSECMVKLLSEQDLTKRRNMCEGFIYNIIKEVRALDEETERRMSEDDTSFLKSPDFWHIQQRKEEMVKEKKKLQDFKEELDRQVHLFYGGVENEDVSQEIYYPPDVEVGGPSKVVLAKPQIAHENFNISGEEEKIPNVVVDNRESAAAHRPTNKSHLTGSEAGLALRQRVPVEDSALEPKEEMKFHTPPTLPSRTNKPPIGQESLEAERQYRTPPVLPPRSSKPTVDRNPLAMTIPAPKIPKSPVTSTSEWACSHCTYLNPININICQICFKTSHNAQIVTANAEEEESQKDYDCNLNEQGEDLSQYIAELRDEQKPKGDDMFDDDEEEDDDDDDDFDDAEENEAALFGEGQVAREQWPGSRLSQHIMSQTGTLISQHILKSQTGPKIGQHILKSQTGPKIGQQIMMSQTEPELGRRIIMSQKQVMEEKKRAKKEFKQKMREDLQKQATSTTVACPDQNSLSSSTTSPSRHPFGIGARPKDSNRVLLNFNLGNNSMNNSSSSNNSSSQFVTPSSVSPGPSANLSGHSSSESGHQSDSIEHSLARMDELHSIDTLQASGAQMARIVKMADLEGYDIQAVQIAVDVCDSSKVKTEPLTWLRTNWRKNVARIVAQVRATGQSHSPNNVGEVSFQEAEEAYIMCQGNIKEAAERCVLNRQALYAQLGDLNNEFPREEILEAMLYCKGNAESAEMRLVKGRLELFQARIWQRQGESVSTAAPGSVNTLPAPSAETSAASTTTAPAGSGYQGLMAQLRDSFIASGPPQQQASSAGSPKPLSAALTGGNAAAGDPYLSFATSVINHQQFQDMMRDTSLNFERRVRMIYVEGRLHSWGRAEMVVKILDQDKELQQDLNEGSVTLEDVVEAVRDCQSRASALAYLRQECQICFGRFPMNKIHNLNICQCRLCQECLVSHFEVAIREKHVRHWVCPQCAQPDLTDPDTASNYLQFLGMQLQPMVTKDLHDLFETKFRDWHLQKMDYFRWCAHCAEGFVAENQGNLLRMTCPRCGERTCFQCKKQWEDQHEGLTCEEFSQWKVDNDPANQSVGLAKHLDENGIDCPNCKMRFALAKGGCMHFKCPQCGHEFCSGCNQAYHHKNMCTKYKLCKNLGLHCHCPRDCFSFLRDYTVDQLQKLLKQNNVAFNTAPPGDQPDRDHCPVMEQKEFAGDTKKDENCGRDALQGGAGLCENHYKEYLVMLINNHNLDPVSLMSKDEMEVLLGRYDLPVPSMRSRITPEAYKASLVKLIQEKLPLRKR
ncbi:E3 ubiquitin-protein ligase rnf31 [Plakobranchus ocellatus]|uniref:E3 ubiquitin-protein ligase rnf31 n=1 Tax=Plakobranchus ocellatus TaxID=259542 RepID=A0AAV3Y4B0_9GAST|nr:E3 ubiquitin-protein ligase rnf31 [Plakobranchus ocellatus]